MLECLLHYFLIQTYDDRKGEKVQEVPPYHVSFTATGQSAAVFMVEFTYRIVSYRIVSYPNLFCRIQDTLSNQSQDHTPDCITYVVIPCRIFSCGKIQNSTYL